MKGVLFNGSPKRSRSNTLHVADAFIGGFPPETEWTRVDLCDCEIRPCQGCFACWSRGEGCVINDDMPRLHALIEASDVIVFSFPLYFFGMPSQVKAFCDRCLPLMTPYQGTDRAAFHEFRDKRMLEKQVAVISSCGYTDAARMYPALTAQLDLIFGENHYTRVYCAEGELFVAQQAKRQKEAYLADVRQAGAEFAADRRISEETQTRLSKPILSPKGFEAVTAGHWLTLHE